MINQLALFPRDKADKGTGLGLSQVHGFGHQSGGTVHIESEVGRGTTLTMYLPRSQEAPHAAAPDSGGEESVASGRVLVVEDNPEVLAVCISMLEQLGYETYAVSGALAALEVIEKQSFDLVISDIVMPGMDGTALANSIRARKPEVPVLLVTGFNPSIGQAEFPVVRKPFDLSVLSRTVAGS